MWGFQKVVEILQKISYNLNRFCKNRIPLLTEAVYLLAEAQKILRSSKYSLLIPTQHKKDKFITVCNGIINDNMKNLVIIGAGVIVALLALYFLLPQDRDTVQDKVEEEFQSETTNENTVLEEDEIHAGDNPQSQVKLKADTFTGTLEQVDTGCFADGECFAVVDGKHITLIMGWSQETAGSIIGVDGIGGLEASIGQKVEVYAQDNSDGTYTLYGSEGFYIKTL